MHSFFEFLSKLNLILFSFAFLLFNSFNFQYFTPYDVQRARDSSRYFHLVLPDKTGSDLITPVQAVLSCYLQLVSSPNPRAISPALSRQLKYIHAACGCRTRPSVHLKLAPPLPEGCLLSCGFLFCSPCTFVYLLSSNLYQRYHCIYFYKVSCTSP